MSEKNSEQVIINETGVEIRGYDKRAKDEFYARMEQFVQVVPEVQYNELLREIGGGGGSLAMLLASKMFMENTTLELLAEKLIHF